MKKIIQIGNIEYKLLNLVDSYKNDGSRLNIYIHDASCKGYNYLNNNGNNIQLFFSEKERDNRLKFLNKYYGIDKKGNNIKGFFPIGIYIKEDKELFNNFNSDFIFGINCFCKTIK